MRRSGHKLPLVLALVAFWSVVGPAKACRQALVLGLDVSASVSEMEYRIQIEGLATALTDPEVVDRMVAPLGQHVELLVFEWGSPEYHRVLAGWTPADSPARLAGMAAKLRSWRRIRFGESTAIGRAMDYAARRLQERRECSQLTVDLSGDGKNNIGTRPRAMRPIMEDRGITVNGLVIATRNIAELSAYYHAEVIVGPFAFVETAGGYEEYAAAIKRKLLRELAAPVAMGPDGARDG